LAGLVPPDGGVGLFNKIIWICFLNRGSSFEYIF
jgi:hypothetical protein